MSASDGEAAALRLGRMNRIIKRFVELQMWEERDERVEGEKLDGLAGRTGRAGRSNNKMK